MNELKIGSTVRFKGHPEKQGYIVAFYSNGVYVSEPSQFAVIASSAHPLTGPNLIFHHSLLEIAVPATPGVLGI